MIIINLHSENLILDELVLRVLASYEAKTAKGIFAGF